MTLITMDTLLWKLLVILTFTATHGQYNYSGADFNNGSCSMQKYYCDSDAVCAQNPEHTRFKCYCPDKFGGDGYSTNYRPKATGCYLIGGPVFCTSTNDCNQFANCVAISDTESQCVCKPGFTGSGMIGEGGCEDVDDCTGNPCAMNAICKETKGGYTCTCDSANNYVGDGNNLCTWVCFSHQDCNINAVCQTEKCKCNKGYEGDGRVCTDINECTNGVAQCAGNSTCINKPGTYSCDCNGGFQKDATTGVCVPLMKTCDEIYRSKGNRLTSGRYTVDLDGAGPLPAIEVDCVLADSFAITEIAPTSSYPQPIPKAGGENPVTFPIDTKPLIDNSPFCSQEVWLECTNKFNGGVVQWDDVKGVRRSGWGGTQDGVCACGQLKRCANGCNCGFGGEGVDSGLVLDKTRLPIRNVIFKVSTGTAGNYIVGKLRCGPKPFGLPKNCDEAKKVNRIKLNTPLWIDIDGSGPANPALVYCNMEQYTHVGIIEVDPQPILIKQTTTVGTPVTYSLPGPDVIAIIDGSVFCSQKVEYQCTGKSRSAAGVQVVSRSGTMTYFPGGSAQQPGSCGCALTGSCDSPTVQCNCDIGDATARRDVGLIIDRSQLPVLNLTTTATNNYFTVGTLQCSQMQFGIEPNCEKYRQRDISQTYAYLVDPDGPEGSSKPFNVKCEMRPAQGITVINHRNVGNGENLGSGSPISFTYLEASPAQIELLKTRSTACIQVVKFTNCVTINIGNVDYTSITTSGKLSTIMVKQCPSGICQCNKDYEIAIPQQNNREKLLMTYLPIVTIKGVSGTVFIGPLKCSEIFPDCESLVTFLNKDGVLGEEKKVFNLMTIDPDGAGGEEPIVITCQIKDTVINPPFIEKQFARLRPGQGPTTQCFPMTYKDMTGAGIGNPQMAALMDSSKFCSQALAIKCTNAIGTGAVSYKTCGGTTVTGLLNGTMQSLCDCGVTGTCSGGPNDGCNCDSSKAEMTMDSTLIINNSKLPICEVCMTLQGINGVGAGFPDSRWMRFEVSQLRCGRKQGIRKNCQMFRQEPDFLALNSAQDPVLDEMYYEKTGEPIIVGCRFYPEPPFGEMIVRPTDWLSEPDKRINGNITVTYHGFSLTSIKEAVDDGNYCTQDIYFFCTNTLPALTGNYGLYSIGKKLATTDYELRDITDKELAKLTADVRFKSKIASCGRPKRLMITKKAMIPLTSILLPSDYNVAVGINDATCAYVERNCDALLKAAKVESDLLSDGYYLIDPDQSGPMAPFKVMCDFIENQGITRVPGEATWSGKVVGADGGDAGAPFHFRAKYPTATPEQINSLVQNSEFCWQGVKYECTGTPLVGGNNYLSGANGQSITSFGTGDNSNFSGCACGLLGTCVDDSYSCNCDNKGSMVDQGVVTSPSVLPITGFDGKIDAKGRGGLTVSEVRCGPTPVDHPKDCATARAWGSRNGINYTRSGSYLINPDFTVARPFMVHCDFSDPNNPKTIVKPQPTDRKPVVNGPDPDVPYKGPNDRQLSALASVSGYCYQGVRVNCWGLTFRGDHITYTGSTGADSSFFSSGVGNTSTCTCGSENRCGGLLSRTRQEATKCNCDIGDNVWRSDAAILRVKGKGPLRKLLSKEFNTASGRLNITVGDLVCAPQPIEYNECATGFNDCAAEAVCIDDPQGYRCECPSGWQGRMSKDTNPDPPMANGRQCIDDDECSLPNLCPIISKCANTPGSYRCDCNDGFRLSPTDKFVCNDINECAENSHDCDAKALCFNTYGSFRCRCRKGFSGSGKAGDCHPIGQCTCFGDPHCISFDGKWTHHMGRCDYTMASNDDCFNADTSGLPKFKVVTRNWDKGYEGSGHYSWVKEVKIRVYDKVVVLGQERSITVDGDRKSKFRKLDSNGNTLIRVEITGFKVELWTDFGLSVQFDGDDQVSLTLPDSLQGGVCGLCGNFNYKPNDDWVVGPQCDADTGSVTTSQQLFGNSWSDGPETCVSDCSTTEPPQTCDYPDAVVTSLCDKLFGPTSPFAAAHCLDEMPAADMEGFRYSCRYDVCHTDNGIAAMCRVATALAEYCADLLSTAIEWRSDSMCGAVTCGENEQYSICGPDHEPTCLEPTPIELMQCRESCYCAKGYMRQGEECVKAENCGCTHGEGEFMKIGEEKLTDNCRKMVSCEDHETIRELPTRCQENEECMVSDEGVMSCQPKPETTPAVGEETTPAVGEETTPAVGEETTPAVGEETTPAVGEETTPAVGDETTAAVVDETTADNQVNPTTTVGLCAGGECTAPNTVCVNGECLCKMGYTADCETCVDVDECEVGEHDCTHVGQKCVNNDGAYTCECLEGFNNNADGFCHDVNECEDQTTNCGGHAECHNLLGTYECVCCAGYSKLGEGCIRDERLDLIYGPPGELCCPCAGDMCSDSSPVCGSDGVTYANYGAMVVTSCKEDKRIEVSYPGYCQDSCSKVECDKPFQTCTLTGPGGAPQCSCPDCSGGASTVNNDAVCGSNGVVYASACVFQLIMCETGRDDISIEDNMEPCGDGDGNTPVGPWSDWGPCDNPCGQGTMTRTRQALTETDFTLEQEAVCYTTCDSGPCRNDTCASPQVCQENAVTGDADCVCPMCGGWPEEPVCGLVGNTVSTFDNECLMRQNACQQGSTNFDVLEERACEDKPRDCGRIRNFASLTDEDGCKSIPSEDIGFCYGGCGEAPGKCCRPDSTYAVTPRETVVLTYQCPDGSTKNKEEEKINACECIEEPQH